MSFRAIFGVVGSFILLSGMLGVSATETVAPASVRFANKTGADVPDFQRHIAPLLGHLGCNGRACHGSFQGRGGFRLSLFGFDFEKDHRALLAMASSENQRRLNRDAPDRSLILQKPTLQIDHEGGQRFKRESWEHFLLQRWIASGARGIEKSQRLMRLEVHPREVVFRDVGEKVQLQLISVWEDGTREDVTCLARFRTNNDSIATVDADGKIVSQGRGDTHIVAFYDNGVASVPVMRPVTDFAGETKRDRPADWDAQNQIHHPIDQLVLTKLNKLRIIPSALSSDAEFLRRVSIDMTGTLPTPHEVASFLNDTSKDKRKHKIDELLERPAYAAWWANKLCDFTGCNPNQQAELGQELSVQWYDWLFTRLQRNVPYDRIVEGIVVAIGRESGQSYDDYAAEVSAFFREESPENFANRTTMPHYWTRSTLKKPEDHALAFAHSFLGIRLQCAQCHKHPWDQWTQQDFQEFSRFFEKVRFGVRPDARSRYRELAEQVGHRLGGDDGSPVRADVLAKARDGKVVPWREIYIDSRDSPIKLSLLRSQQITLDKDEDPREKIFAWMCKPDNPWFARAIVNRVWANYFHVGIVDPPDDFNPANPPSNPQLLDWLASKFVANEFDLRWLHRQIANSATYQRSWRPNETNRHDRRNFSRAIPRRIPAEVVYDGLKQATAATNRLDEVRNDLSRRASGHLSMRMAGTYAMNVFGKPDRAMNCDCERVNEPTLLQSVFLKNDPLVRLRLQSSGWIAEIGKAKNPDRDQLIQTAWLRTVGRAPTEREFQRAREHLDATESVAEGITDLLWALINTKEFVLNH